MFQTYLLEENQSESVSRVILNWSFNGNLVQALLVNCMTCENPFKWN